MSYHAIHPALALERIGRPFQVFLRNQISGSILLLTAAAAAMAAANSRWSPTYFELLQLEATVAIGPWELTKPVLLWINDGLMGFFFFVVGLEIKREILVGELATARRAALPIAGAFGGMAVPAALFLFFNWGTPAARGWGIPMATDIAFSLGVLMLLGSRVPVSLKIFLTALAIADDIGAVLVIAFFYTEELTFVSLLVGGVLLGVSLLANRLGVRSPVFYFCIGTLVWLSFLQSGVHATVAAVLMAFTIPARTRIDRRRFVEETESLLELFRKTGRPEGGPLLSHRQHGILDEIGRRIDHATAPLQRLESSLAPLVNLAILPLFALANAGVEIDLARASTLGGSLGLGLIAGLFVGKQLGILSASWIAVRLRLAELPSGADWRQVHGVAVLGGIGFTMSLFVSALAFYDHELRTTAKLAILVASVLSAVVGATLLWMRPATAEGEDL